MLNIFSVCSVNSVVNDTLINLKPLGQVSVAFFDMTGNRPDPGHNFLNIQAENVSIFNKDATIHDHIAHVRTFGRIDDMGFGVVDGHQMRSAGVDDDQIGLLADF